VKLYADAANRDPDFFATWRTLQAYKDVFEAGKSRLVLSPDSGFLGLLKTPPVDLPQAAAAPK
jgi:membrane protease subunit HflC